MGQRRRRVGGGSLRVILVAALGAVLVAGLAACSTGGGSATPDRSAPTVAEPDASERGTSGAFEELHDGCLDVVDALPPPGEVAGDVDVGALAAAGRLPAPPPYTGLPMTVADVEVAPDTESFFESNPDVIAPEERREAFERLGFRGALTVHLEVRGVEYTVSTLRFESPAAAVEYRDLHLRRVCSEANRLRPIDGVPGAASYVRVGEDSKVPRAVLVIGDTEVNLGYCGCVDSFDPIDSLTGWAQMIPQVLEVAEVEPGAGA